MDLALNNQQWLIWHQTKPNQATNYWCLYINKCFVVIRYIKGRCFILTCQAAELNALRLALLNYSNKVFFVVIRSLYLTHTGVRSSQYCLKFHMKLCHNSMNYLKYYIITNVC